MSVDTPAQTPRAAQPQVQNSSSTLVALLPYVVSAVTIIGLIVLLALGKIDQTAGVSLIAALAGGHLTVAAANQANVK